MPTPERRSGPPPQRAAADNTPLHPYRNRHWAAVRLPQLWCRCRDPLLCRCEAPEPSEKAVDGYADAIHHLHQHGLTPAPLVPELRVLWRRSADARRLVQSITERWVVA